MDHCKYLVPSAECRTNKELFYIEEGYVADPDPLVRGMNPGPDPAPDPSVIKQK
jgi:hypothetical protein